MIGHLPCKLPVGLIFLAVQQKGGHQGLPSVPVGLDAAELVVVVGTRHIGTHITLRCEKSTTESLVEGSIAIEEELVDDDAKPNANQVTELVECIHRSHNSLPLEVDFVDEAAVGELEGDDTGFAAMLGGDAGTKRPLKSQTHRPGVGTRPVDTRGFLRALAMEAMRQKKL